MGKALARLMLRESISRFRYRNCWICFIYFLSFFSLHLACLQLCYTLSRVIAFPANLFQAQRYKEILVNFFPQSSFPNYLENCQLYMEFYVAFKQFKLVETDLSKVSKEHLIFLFSLWNIEKLELSHNNS